jgi:hypothetical protein
MRRRPGSGGKRGKKVNTKGYVIHVVMAMVGNLIEVRSNGCPILIH